MTLYMQGLISQDILGVLQEHKNVIVSRLRTIQVCEFLKGAEAVDNFLYSRKQITEPVVLVGKGYLQRAVPI